MKKIAFLFYVFSFLGFGNLSQAKTKECLVVRVVDGDTLYCDYGKERAKVRLFNIDAPELHQRFGKEATQILANLVLNKKVKLQDEGKDTYNRKLGIIFHNGNNINLEMVALGYAWAYYKAPEQYDLAQKQARKHRLGLWRDFNPMEPYKYRKKHPISRQRF